MFLYKKFTKAANVICYNLEDPKLVYVIQWSIESTFSVHVLAIFSFNYNMNGANIISFNLQNRTYIFFSFCSFYFIKYLLSIEVIIYFTKATSFSRGFNKTQKRRFVHLLCTFVSGEIFRRKCSIFKTLAKSD